MSSCQLIFKLFFQLFLQDSGGKQDETLGRRFETITEGLKTGQDDLSS